MTTFSSRKFTISLGLIFSLLFAAALRADVGSDNPTGTSGQFNGNTNTACSYDPYTANATRSVTDITVAGGVGAYPLAFTRTMNSRYTVGSSNLPAFGVAGTWTHSYQWSIDSTSVTGTGFPTSYAVNYPDGRRILFSNTGTGDVDFRGPAGVRDRFMQLKSGVTECYLRLPDGGQVWFHPNSSTVSGTTTYTFTLKGIIDPYGQTTTVTTSGTTTTIKEPAGRTLQIVTRLISNTTEGALNDIVVDHVTASDGRTVQYHYTAFVTANGTRYTSLTSVGYFGDSSLTATYTYQVDNIDANGRPLIKTCIDPMYDGPMWKIGYKFATGTGVVYGQILSENYFDGTTVGVAVSTLTVNNTTTRTETRGDGHARTFIFGGYLLKSATDFKGVAALQTYNSTSFYLESTTDRNGNLVNYSCAPLFGLVKQVTYPTSSDISPSGGQTILSYIWGGAASQDTNNQDPNNPYWLFQGADGTQYLRDSHHQVYETVTTIDSNFNTPPWTRSDLFTYNDYGQVVTHTLPLNLGSETYQYDSGNPGRVVAFWDAMHPTSGGPYDGKPTAWYQYDSLGRVSGITDPLGASGDVNHTTTFQYNSRGQLTRLTHPPDSDGNVTYIQYAYNPNGTLAWTADERHPGAVSDPNQRTSYIYDDYKRLLSVTTPARSAGDSLPRTTIYNYDPSGSGTGYARTAAAQTKVTSPGGKVVNTSYDENVRTLNVTVVGDSNVPSAVTSYTYDNNGNVKTLTDPNGQSTGAVTTYYYDHQNRVSDIDDPISTDRNTNNHTQDYRYDVSGNVVQEVRADSAICTYARYSNGSVTQRTGFNGEITYYGYDVLGNTTSYEEKTNVLIPLGNNEFTYKTLNYINVCDALGRKTKTTYPADVSGNTRSESYTYNVANHLYQYKNPAGQTKTLTYDNRGRLTNTSWDANGQDVTITYDSTRPTSIANWMRTIHFGYDEANNRIYENQGLGSGTSCGVYTDPDADGNRSDLVVKYRPNSEENPGVMTSALYFDYTSRNELLNIYDNAHQPFFKYSYDASGNVTQRLNHRLSNDTTVMQYDALNRPKLCSQSGPNGTNLSSQSGSPGTNFATSHYDYNRLGTLKDITRDEEPNVGDYFTYDNLNQLQTATYSGTAPSTNAKKIVTYVANSRNWGSVSVLDNTATPPTNPTTTFKPDDLNQYVSAQVNNGPLQSIGYDANFNLTNYNGWTYTYDAENHLSSAVNAVTQETAQFFYDGLGRCVRRVINGIATNLFYDQWTPILETDDYENEVVGTNVYGRGDDELLYRWAWTNFYDDPSQYFVKSDPMGNVTFLLDQNGYGIEKYKYDAFGQPTITDWSGNVQSDSAYGNRFMFSGREWLALLGLYDMRHRVYDPALGRFYQVDPIGFDGDALNLYRFCGNNPTSGGDPAGLEDPKDNNSGGGSISGGGYDPDTGGSWSYYDTYSADGSSSGQIWTGQPGAGPLSQAEIANILSGGSDSSNLSSVTAINDITAPEAVEIAGGGEQGHASQIVHITGMATDVSEYFATRNAEQLQAAGRFSFLNKTPKMGFRGNQAAGYSALEVAAAKVSQRNLLIAGKMVKVGGVGLGIGLSVNEVVRGGASNQSIARGFIGTVETGTAFLIPPPGLGLMVSVGIGFVDAAHGFDWLYNRFDNTPRFPSAPIVRPVMPVVSPTP